MSVISDQATALRRLAESRSPAEAAVKRCPVIAIASGKGGVGKTTLAVSMAIGFARRGLKTALIDADLGLANADVLCGLRPTARLTEAVHRVSEGGRVSVDLLRRISMAGPMGVVLVPGMVGAPPGASGRDARVAVSHTRDLLSRAMDVVVVDHGAGLGQSVREGMRAASVPIVVATPDPASLADAYALVKSLRSIEGCGVPTMLINRSKDESEAQAAHARVAEVAARFLSVGLPMLGYIPEDPSVSRCSQMRRPMAIAAPKCNASRHLDQIVERLANEFSPPERTGHRAARRPFVRLARLMRGR